MDLLVYTDSKGILTSDRNMTNSFSFSYAIFLYFLPENKEVTNKGQIMFILVFVFFFLVTFFANKHLKDA